MKSSHQSELKFYLTPAPYPSSRRSKRRASLCHAWFSVSDCLISNLHILPDYANENKKNMDSLPQGVITNTINGVASTAEIFLQFWSWVSEIKVLAQSGSGEVPLLAHRGHSVIGRERGRRQWKEGRPFVYLFKRILMSHQGLTLINSFKPSYFYRGLCLQILML